MKYKAIMRISDIVVAIEDWKREVISDSELADAFLAGYKTIKEDADVPVTMSRKQAIAEKKLILARASH